MDYYRQGLRINPTSEILLYNLACCFEKISKFKNTIRWLEHALSVKQRWTDAFYGLAMTYFKMGDYQQSSHYIENAIESYRE